jgi:hypothetical protein
MATSDAPTDRSTADQAVIDELQQCARNNTRVSKLLQYLRGNRNPGEIDMQHDVIPALQHVQGEVAMTFRHDGKTEYVWPAKTTDAVSSCYYDDGRAHMEGVPISREELADWRKMPQPSDFVPANNIEIMRPERALGGAE